MLKYNHEMWQPGTSGKVMVLPCSEGSDFTVCTSRDDISVMGIIKTRTRPQHKIEPIFQKLFFILINLFLFITDLLIVFLLLHQCLSLVP